MNCNFAIKVSMMLDGELSAEERQEIKTHIANCTECRSIEKDFSFLSNQIREIDSAATVQAAEIKYFYPEKRNSIWKKRFFIPASAFGVVVLIFAGLGVWFLITQFGKDEQAAKNPNQTFSPKLSATDKSSLEIFDKGGRAEFYIVQRQTK